MCRLLRLAVKASSPPYHPYIVASSVLRYTVDLFGVLCQASLMLNHERWNIDLATYLARIDKTSRTLSFSLGRRRYVHARVSPGCIAILSTAIECKIGPCCGTRMAEDEHRGHPSSCEVVANSRPASDARSQRLPQPLLNRA